MIDILPALTGLTQGLRGLALFAGIILILDGIKLHAGLIEDPPHCPKGNARSWLLVSIGAIIGGWAILDLGTHVFSAYKTPLQTVASTLMWGFMSAGLVYRATLRTQRPSYIFVSSGLFLFTATALFLGKP